MAKEEYIAQMIQRQMPVDKILDKTENAYRTMLEYENNNPGVNERGDMRLPIEFYIDNPDYTDARIGSTRVAIALDEIAAASKKNVARLYDSNQWGIEDHGGSIILRQDLSLSDAYEYLNANDRVRSINQDTGVVFEPNDFGGGRTRNYTEKEERKDVILGQVEPLMNPEKMIAGYRNAYKDTLNLAADAVSDKGSVKSDRIVSYINIDIDTSEVDMTEKDVEDAINTLRQNRDHNHNGSRRDSEESRSFS